MATKTYSTRRKVAGVKHTMPCVNTSSDLFDSFVSHAKKSQSPSTSPVKTKTTSKNTPGSGKKGGKTTCTPSPIMYRYSYSPSTAVATTIRKESPTKGKSGAKKKISPKQKVSLKIFDFTSDDESDGASKKVKTGSKGVQKDNSRTDKKTMTKKTTKKATSGQLSDGNQVSDSEYSSQDSQTQSTAVETKTKSPKKTKTAGQKTAKKSAPQKTVGGETNGKSAPAASMKRKSTTVSEKATPPKKPRVETPLTPPPGKTRVTRSGRLTRSTYRAAALWGEKMDTSESSQLHEAAAMDVEDPIQVMDAVLSVGDSKVEEKGSPEREVEEVGEGDVVCKEGSPEKEVEKKSEVKGGEEDSAVKDVEEVGVKDVEEPCSQEAQVSDKDVASGFDVLDSDQPDERSVVCLDDDNEPERGCVSTTTSRQVDELVSGTISSDSGAKGSSAADVTKSKCDDGESAVSSEQREKRSPTPEPPGPSASSSSKLDEKVSGVSKEPVSIVVEEWEESQEGAKDGGEEEEESMDVSFSEPVDEPANPKLFERHLVPSLTKSNSGTCGSSKSFSDIDVPSLTRTSSWPRCSSGTTKGNNGSQKTGVRCSRQEKELITVVRNVREAHECLEMGESQQFFDEMDYLLDNISPEQPLNVRCLGTCNLASHCLDTEFSRQMRAHGFTNKIISHLKDSLQHPGLCLSTATLFYVMTRDRYNSEWSRAGVDLLVGMLAAGGMEADLTGKTAREFSRTKTKARALLETAMEKHSPRQEPPDEKEEEGKEEEREEEEEGERVERKPGAAEHHFRVDVENISVCELSREALLALTSPQHNPHWMREELRISGALDHLANMVISGCELLEGGVEECEGGEGGDKCEGGEGTERRLRVLERVLKTLENVTLMNKDNQSYLVVFDGSLLVSKLTRLVTVCHSLAKEEPIRHAAVDCLLAVMKLLLNLTHDSELGSHRVGGQKGAMEAILSTIFQLPDLLPEEHHFDIIVLGLGLLINMSEHSSQNRTQLQSTKIDDHSTESSQETANKEEEDIRMMQDDVMGCHGSKSSMKALIRLFLKHHAKSEQVSIEVPTPQRLSQLSSSPHSSPLRAASQVRRDLTPSFTAGGRPHRLGKTHRSRSPKKAAGSLRGDESQDSDGMGWLPEDQEEKVESEEEEEFESIPTDPLVFSREEFDTALNQAGRHMEDSIVASYTALLLGILAKHNPDSVDAIRREMPSKNFSDMIAVLRKFVSFMNIAGTSGSGLDSIRHIVKYLEAL